MSQIASDPDVDSALEQAWQNLYAKLDQVAPVSPQQRSEQQAMAMIKALGQELRLAAQALQKVAETLKMQPNLTVQQRLQLANWTIAHSRRAREAAESVLG
jgi:hypothetical protein